MITLDKKFSQNDGAWKNAQLGTKGTIGLYGCLLTCATMALDYFKKWNETPLSVNAKMAANGGYSGGNLFVWSVFASLFGLKYSGQYSNSAALTAAQMNQIRATLDKGYPVLLQIDTVPATSGLDEHWILAIGYDKQSPDDLIIQDPWDGAEKRITSWGVAPQKLIYAWCWYDGPLPSVQPVQEMITIPVAERDFLIGRATTIKDLASFIPLDDPDHTPLDKFKQYIAGLRSRITSLDNDIRSITSQLQNAQTEVANQKDKVANVQAQCQVQLKLKQDEIDALNGSSKAIEKLKGSYEGTISGLQKQIRELQKNGGIKDTTITELKTQLESCKKGQLTPGKKNKILEMLQKLLQ